jgi:glycosyltransferase involved in cell wall biosynthesis
MRVLQYYNWGYYEPITCGADVIAANQMEYFRRRGWDVDVLLRGQVERAHQAEAFHRRYPWARSVRLAVSETQEFSFRGQLFAHEQIARSDVFQDLARRDHDLFLTNYAFSAPLARALPSRCKKLLEALDIVSDSFALYERSKSLRPAALADPCESFYWKLELELYRLFDKALFINEEESRLVERFFPGKAVAVPPMVPSELLHAADSTSDALSEPIEGDSFDLIFVGSNALANINGISFFYRRIFLPYLREHHVRMALVGKVCDQLNFSDRYVTKLGEIGGDLRPIYQQSKIVIIPILEGTGLPIKTIECLANGRAVVTSPVGARGLRHDPEAFLQLDMTNDPKGAAQAILDLLSSEPRRLCMQRKAEAYYRANFGVARYLSAMDKVMESIGIPGQSSRAESAASAPSDLDFTAAGERQPRTRRETAIQGRSRCTIGFAK